MNPKEIRAALNNILDMVPKEYQPRLRAGEIRGLLSQVERCFEMMSNYCHRMEQKDREEMMVAMDESMKRELENAAGTIDQLLLPLGPKVRG